MIEHALACALGDMERCLHTCCGSAAAGSARAVNRRYIADFVSKKDRFKASAGVPSMLHSLRAHVSLCLVRTASSHNPQGPHVTLCHCPICAKT